MKGRRKLDKNNFDESVYNESQAIELVQGMTEIKMNNCERQSRVEWENSQLRLFRIKQTATRLQQWQEGGGLIIGELRNVMITFMAAQAVISGSMTLGMMLAIHNWSADVTYFGHLEFHEGLSGNQNQFRKNRRSP